MSTLHHGDSLDALRPGTPRTHPEHPMSSDITFHIVADTDPIIRQLRRLHYELSRLRRRSDRRRVHLDRRRAVGWRHRKGQARR